MLTRLWKFLLPFLFIFILVHLLKDITQDIFKVPTLLDRLGDIKEDVSGFPVVIQRGFTFLAFASFFGEAVLLMIIPKAYGNVSFSRWDKMAISVVLFLGAYFLLCILFDPNTKLI